MIKNETEKACSAIRISARFRIKGQWLWSLSLHQLIKKWAVPRTILLQRQYISSSLYVAVKKRFHLLLQSDLSAAFLRAARSGNYEKVVEFLKENRVDIDACNVVRFLSLSCRGRFHSTGNFHSLTESLGYLVAVRRSNRRWWMMGISWTH